jgi:DNA-binding LacI/PurR family transcriptional regulator
MSTIYKIAGKTGFSASTVARALSGRGYCGKKTKEIILRTARTMNYVPVQAAKTLKNKITNKIMFCIPDILNPYYFRMIGAVNDVLEQQGYYTILAYSEHNIEKEIKIIEALESRFVDGLIIGSFDFNERLVETIRKCHLPVVLTNLYKSQNDRENFDCVYVDHTKAVFIATTHLLQQGHRNICLMDGSIREQTGYERLQGYRRALKEYQVPYRKDLVVQSDFTREGGYRDFTAFMEGRAPGELITAVVACNDLMGIGCLHYCRENSLRAPEDISIVTLDNSDYSLCTYPQLSSIDMMQYRIGENAARLLLERIQEKRDYKKIVRLEPELVIRKSVLPAG